MQNSESDFDQRWTRVNAVVNKMLKMENVPHAVWQATFSDVFSIVMWNETTGPTKIKESLTETISEYIKNVRKSILQSQDETSLLKNYIVQWNKFIDRAEFIPLPFTHMDMHVNGKHQVNYLNPRHMQESSVRKLMLEMWNSSIYEQLKKRLMDSAIQLIQNERHGQVIDSSLVIGVRDSCASLPETTISEKPGYLDQLLEIYITATENFYRPVIAELIQKRGIREYTQYATQRLLEEGERGKRYLETTQECSSVTTLMKACVRIFVIDYMDQLLTEVPKLLREHNMELLRRFYELIYRVPGGSENLLPIFEQHVKQAGLQDIQSSADSMLKDANKYVEKLLELYSRFTSIVHEAFNNDPLLLASRDKAYQEIVNDTSVFTTEIPLSVRSGVRRVESRCPELLASYCDLMLRKSPVSRRLSSDEVEKLLENVLLVLKYVNSKDIFMRVYKTHLIRRLLLETSADNEMEEMMVDRLRNVGMPAEHINKLSRMFQDIKISQDLTTNFKEEYRISDSAVPVDGTLVSRITASSPSTNVDVVNILILTSGSWMLQSEEKAFISLPSELDDFPPLIEEFYKRKHQGRNLLWQHHLSHGLLLFTSDRGRFELEVTVYQLVVLYAWSRRFDQRLSLDSLLTATGLQENELRRTLWTLCEHPKMEEQIVLYSPRAKSEKEFSESTVFWINLNFTNSKSSKSLARRRLNLIGRLQLTQETSNEEETMAIVELRQLRTQEAVIKVLKTRKRMYHNELYKELVELLRCQFVPSKRLVKEVLEWLIERQYVRRHETDKDMFIYVT